MKRSSTAHRRGPIGSALQRDLQRQQRRRDGASSFWRSLRVLGMVGWPIALASAGGAWLGRSLDARWQTGNFWTLALIGVGVGLGCLVAWQAIQEQKP